MVKGKVESQNQSLRFWLQRLTNMIVRNVTVHLNNASTAYTDGMDTYIGVDGEVVQGEKTEKGKFYMSIGLLLHELAHVLYTPFKGRGALEDYGTVAKMLLTEGTFPDRVFPTQTFDKEFFSKFRGLLGRLYSQFSNAVCDGHIEQRMLKDYPYWRKEIMYMRNKWYITAKSYDDLKQEGVDKNTMLASFTLDYSLNHDCKTYGADDDFVKSFNTLKPYIDSALSEKDGQRRIKLVNDAFCKMISIMDWTKPSENTKKDDSGNSGESSQGQSQDSQTQDQNQGQGQTQDQNQNGNSDSNDFQSNEDNQSESSDASNDENDSDSGNSSDSSDDSDNDSDDSSNSEGSSNEQGDDDDSSSDGNDSDSSTQDENCKSEKTDSSDGDDSNEENSNSNQNESNNNGDSNEQNGSDGSQNSTDSGSNSEPMTEEEIENILSEMLQTVSQGQSDGNEGQDRGNVCNMSVSNCTSPSNEDSSNLDVDTMFQQIEEGNDTRFGEINRDYVQYALKKITDDLASKLTLSLRRKLRDEKETYAKGLYVGKRLDTKRLYRADKRIMERRKYPDRPSMKVILLMDISGSIGSGETRTEERKIALSILKTCKKLNIECEEYAFNTAIAPLLCEDDILSVRTGGGTDDAMAFRFALNRMKKVKAYDRRMIFVLTDGCGDGHSVLAPMLKTCKSEKIGVIACGLGSARDTVERSWSGYGAKVLDCDSDSIASELCQAIVKAYK